MCKKEILSFTTFIQESSNMICHYPCSHPVKSPTSLRFFGMWSSMTAPAAMSTFLKRVSREGEQCTADAFIFAFMLRAVDSEWFKRARQHQSTVSHRAASLKLVLGISYKRQETRDAWSGGAARHAAIAWSVWGKSFSFLNAFLKFSKLCQM